MYHTRTLQITILAILTLILDASTRIYAQLQRTPITALYPQHQDLCIIDSTISTWQAYGKKSSGTWIYEAIYFDRKKVQYYSVTNIQETNNIFFSFNPKKQEKVFRPDIRECEEQMLYVGNVSQLERVYVDTNDNKQYIKTLIPKKLDRYYAVDPKDLYGPYIQNKKLKDNKLYPAMIPVLRYKYDQKTNSMIMYTNHMTVGFTNKSGQIFCSLSTEKKPAMSPQEWEAYNKAAMQADYTAADEYNRPPDGYQE